MKLRRTAASYAVEKVGIPLPQRSVGVSLFVSLASSSCKLGLTRRGRPRCFELARVPSSTLKFGQPSLVRQRRSLYLPRHPHLAHAATASGLHRKLLTHQRRRNREHGNRYENIDLADDNSSSGCGARSWSSGCVAMLHGLFLGEMGMAGIARTQNPMEPGGKAGTPPRQPLAGVRATHFPCLAWTFRVEASHADPTVSTLAFRAVHRALRHDRFRRVRLYFLR